MLFRKGQTISRGAYGRLSRYTLDSMQFIIFMLSSSISHQYRFGVSCFRIFSIWQLRHLPLHQHQHRFYISYVFNRKPPFSQSSLQQLIIPFDSVPHLFLQLIEYFPLVIQYHFLLHHNITKFWGNRELCQTPIFNIYLLGLFIIFETRYEKAALTFSRKQLLVMGKQSKSFVRDVWFSICTENNFDRRGKKSRKVMEKTILHNKKTI